MDALETIGTLIEYGIAFAVMATIIIGFMTDTIRSGKSAERELSRERELSDKKDTQLDKLTDALADMSNALEKRNDLEEALRQERIGR